VGINTASTPRLSRRNALRLGLSALGVAGAGTALSGCAGTLTKPAPGDTVTFINTNATWEPGFDAASKVLKKKCGYVLQSRGVSNTSNFQQIVRMSSRTDTSSDLIKWWNGYRLVDVARDGMLADVTSAWDLAEKNGWIDDPELKKSFTYDGKQYGMPLYKTYYVVFYSKKAFAKVGAEVPTTWDEFIDVCNKLKKAKITPIASGGANSWESCIWFGQVVNGTDHQFYLDLTEGRASYLDQKAVDAMKLWVELYQRDFFSAPDIDSSTVPGLFNSGKVGMQLYGTWNTGSFTGAGMTDKDFGEFILPAMPGGTPSIVVESSPLSVSSEAHKKNAAMKIEDVWLDPDVQTAWINFLQDLSANPEIVPHAAGPRDIAAAVAKQKPSQAIRYWEASPPPLIEGNVLDLSAFMTNPTPGNIKPTLAKLQKRAEKEWKAWNL
jgi:multiple sugar transport system substrate-binding protein